MQYGGGGGGGGGGIYKAYPFILWLLWKYAFYILSSSSNRKYGPVAIF